jgi:hypothetical protein
MRRIAAVVVFAACLLMVAGPAGAATNHYSSTVLNVYWTTRTQTGPNSYRETTWYVGVYSDSQSGTSSDGYYSEQTCVYRDARHRRCKQNEYKVGYSNLDKKGESYTFDGQDLSAAHLVGIYPLQSYDQYGNPTGDVEWTVFHADVTGTGSVRYSRDTYSHHDRDCYTKSATTRANRPFVATGSENGNDLGSTSQGIMSSSETTTVTYGSCGY